MLIFNLDYFCTSWYGLGFGSTLNNWEFLKETVTYTEEAKEKGHSFFRIIIDTDNEMRTIIRYKTFFECMLETGVVVEVF
jgi:hypothetical protein